MLDLVEQGRALTVEDIYAIPVLKAAWSRHSIGTAIATAVAGTRLGRLEDDGYGRIYVHRTPQAELAA